MIFYPSCSLSGQSRVSMARTKEAGASSELPPMVAASSPSWVKAKWLTELTPVARSLDLFPGCESRAACTRYLERWKTMEIGLWPVRNGQTGVEDKKTPVHIRATRTRVDGDTLLATQASIHLLNQEHQQSSHNSRNKDSLQCLATRKLTKSPT